jgi:hypothetical protein
VSEEGAMSTHGHIRGEHVYHYPSLINIDYTRFQGKITYSEGLILLRKVFAAYLIHTALKSKNKDWLSQNQDNVSE